MASAIWGSFYLRGLTFIKMWMISDYNLPEVLVEITQKWKNQKWIDVISSE